MAEKLEIKRFELGDWATNCYVVHAAPTPGQSVEGRPCWIIDAGFDPSQLVKYIREKRLVPAAVVLTHAHLDHIAGLEAIRAIWPGVPILLHEAEHEFLTRPELNLSVVLEEPIVAPEATGTLTPDTMIGLDGIPFHVLATPGHSPGGVSLYQPDNAVVFPGDALFSGSIGRYDFPTSDGETLMKSIATQLLTLPDQTRVYPGHGPDTTIGREKMSNPYLRGLVTKR